MQIPFVGFQPIRTSEHMAAAGVFGLLQLYGGVVFLTSRLTKSEAKYDDKSGKRFLFRPFRSRREFLPSLPFRLNFYFQVSSFCGHRARCWRRPRRCYLVDLARSYRAVERKVRFPMSRTFLV